MIRAVLWDIDGTLLESEPAHWRAVVAVSRRHGAEIADEDLVQYVGLSMAACFRRLADRHPMPVDYDAWLEAVTDHYVERVDAVEPRAEALEHADLFAARGLAQACVSNSGRRVVEANLARMARPAFRFGISRDDVVNPKPHPEPYLAAAARLGVEPAACLAVEDSPVGAAAAVAAGMRVVAWPQWEELRFDGVAVRTARLADVDWDALLA